MKSKILKVKTIGSRAEGNLRPEIVDDLPRNLGLSVIEYGSGFAIVKVSWSEHPLVPKPLEKDLTKLWKHDSIQQVLTSHPKEKELKSKRSILSSLVDELPEKKIKLKKERKGIGLEGSYIRKEYSINNQEDTYVLDED